MKKLLLLSLTVLLFSCGDSDSINDPSLIGKWYFNTSEFFIDDSLMGIENYLANEVNGCRTYIEFKTNQSFDYLGIAEGNCGDSQSDSGNWELNDNIITLYSSYDDGFAYNNGVLDLEIITINNSELVVRWLCPEESLEYPNGCSADFIIIDYLEKYD